MRIISVRLSDEEHASLMRRAGKGRGALSRYLRQRIQEPRYTVAFSAASTVAAPAFVEWMTGHVGQTLTLRSH